MHLLNRVFAGFFFLLFLRTELSDTVHLLHFLFLDLSLSSNFIVSSNFVFKDTLDIPLRYVKFSAKSSLEINLLLEKYNCQTVKLYFHQFNRRNRTNYAFLRRAP